jgi:hypothetical protein
LEKLLKKEDKIFLLLTASFISLLVISNVIAGKVISIYSLTGPAAVVCYALTFVITDTIAEIWGKERTKYIVFIGFFASILSAVMIKMAILLPSASFWNSQKEYELILGSNFRIVIASMLAYIISQNHDIWAFHFWKKKTKGKYLWIRNNFSTGISQLIDTSIFIIVAFYGTGVPILSMIIGQYIIKLIIAVLDTPLVYLLVRVLKNKNIIDYKNTTTCY